MTDASSSLNSRRVELQKQGRVTFTKTGNWSRQGFIMDSGDIENPKCVYDGYWPEGELNSDWAPCDWIDGGRCKPYGNGEIGSKLREWDDEIGNMIFTEKGAWAPKIIQNLVEMGLDMGVWNVNSPESCFVTMCSVCGSCIVKPFDDGTDPDFPTEPFIRNNEWTPFFG